MDGKVIAFKNKVLMYTHPELFGREITISENGIEMPFGDQRVFEGYNVFVGHNGGCSLYKNLSDNVFYSQFGAIPYKESLELETITLPEGYTIGDIKTVYDDKNLFVEFNDGNFYQCLRQRQDDGTYKTVHTFFDVLSDANRQGKVKRVVVTFVDEYTIMVCMDDGLFYYCYFLNSDSYNEYIDSIGLESLTHYENPFKN